MRIITIAIILTALPVVVLATEEYATKTGRPCATCHLDPGGGGELTPDGSYFLTHDSLPPRDEAGGDRKPVLTLSKNVRLLAGFLHLFFGVVWFGAIFYIHIIIGPRKLRSGIPLQERLLGVASMFMVGGTGILLTLNRVSGLADFTEGSFGKILAVKIVLFLLMVCLAIIAITVLQGRMSGKRLQGEEVEAKLSAAALEDYDGRGERPAYIVVDGVVYDVSSSRLWEGGSHMRRHRAGTDLTEELKTAPHGKEVLETFAEVGLLAKKETVGRKITPAVRIFEVFAYINLALAFFILVCLALWWWGAPEL